MPLLDSVKIGPPGAEIEFPAANHLTGLQLSLAAQRREARSIIREVSASLLRRHGAEMRLTLEALSESQALGLASLAGLPRQEVAAIAVDWLIRSEEYALETSTTFTMKSNSFLLLDRAYAAISGARQVNLVGVYDDLVLAGDHAGIPDSNRIATSEEDALDRTTWIVTLDTAGTAGARVFVDYKVSGILGLMSGDVHVMPAREFGTDGQPLYNISLRVEGA